ncbi:protein serine/threonine phosphatase 2C [Gloeopeniophorella convolvens]|nr:protein serine/threonine phosphatase 2C [Gloeopeniophorella convolvens]
MYAQRVVPLTAASSLENLRALHEVRDFATTDLGRGGPGRWTYRILQEPILSTELQRLAGPFSTGSVDGVSFQPCQLPEFKSQDRACVESWPMPTGGSWIFTAIFDGHAGHSTVEHTSRTLPGIIRRSLESLLHSSKGSVFPDAVSKILSDCIVAFDHSITADFMRMFPGGAAGLQKMSSTQIRQLFQDRTSASQNLTAATRCLQGSTALLTLTDPAKHNLWIANLGDCQAVLGSRTRPGEWSATFATTLHDGDNPSEIHRIRNQHPGERDCTEDNRVIGFLGPTRCEHYVALENWNYLKLTYMSALGDTWLKIPSIFSQRVLLNFRREWNVQRPETYIARVKSPPYVSNTPDVHHIPLPKTQPGRHRGMFLIMCSDGLADLHSGRSRTDMIHHWVRVAGQCIEGRMRTGNVALSLLREGLGGDDIRLVSENLTVEMEERWMDDVTILVQQL